MQRIPLSKQILIALLLLGSMATKAQQHTGVYSYSKGLNKPNGTLYVIHFKPDSAFFYLSTLSGSPDFFATDMRGYMSIDSNSGWFRTKDQCRVHFRFTGSKVDITQDSTCRFEYSTEGAYKKTAPTAKRSATMLINYTERVVKPSSDTLLVYTAPHVEAATKKIMCRENDLKIIDEFRSFYLVEHKKYKTEFLWVPKSLFPLPQKK